MNGKHCDNGHTEVYSRISRVWMMKSNCESRRAPRPCGLLWVALTLAIASSTCALYAQCPAVGVSDLVGRSGLSVTSSQSKVFPGSEDMEEYPHQESPNSGNFNEGRTGEGCPTVGDFNHTRRAQHPSVLTHALAWTQAL